MTATSPAENNKLYLHCNRKHKSFSHIIIWNGVEERTRRGAAAAVERQKKKKTEEKPYALCMLRDCF